MAAIGALGGSNLTHILNSYRDNYAPLFQRHTLVYNSKARTWEVLFKKVAERNKELYLHELASRIAQEGLAGIERPDTFLKCFNREWSQSRKISQIQIPPGDILFKSKDPSFGVLSNFFPMLISPESNPNEVYLSAEHLYQYEMVNPSDPATGEAIRREVDPFKVKRLATSSKKVHEQETQMDKLQVMQRITHRKFALDPVLADFLKRTGKCQIIENTENEFWGRGSTGTGENHLGRLLQEERDFLQSGPNP